MDVQHFFIVLSFKSPIIKYQYINHDNGFNSIRLQITGSGHI